MKQVSEAQVLFDIYEEFEGFSIAGWENYLKRSIREALPIIGMPAEHYFQSQEVLIDEDGAFPVPDGVQALWAVLLIDDKGQAIEPAFLRPSTIEMSSDTRIKIPYNPSSLDFGPAVRYDQLAGVFFIENWESQEKRFEKALVSYTAFKFNKDGELMMPEIVTVAVKAYLAYRVKVRLRNRNGNTIPMSEVNEALEYWGRMAGDAKGRLKATPRPRFQELAREEWYRSRFVTPYRRLGQ